MISQFTKIEEFFKKYGKLAIGTHLVMSGISITLFYTAFSMGLDYKKYFPKRIDESERESLKQNDDEDKPKENVEVKSKGRLGTFTAAFIAHKAATPFRIPIEIAIVTFIAKRLKM